MKRFVCILLVFSLLFGAALPAFASAQGTQAEASAEEEKQGCDFAGFFQRLWARVKSFFGSVKYYFQVKKEHVPNTMNKNAIHMLQSVEDTICDSFIITTEDGKVIAIDGGHTAETDYFIRYLQAVTGLRRPKIDAWFLTHPHNDHVEVFTEVAGNRAKRVTFDRVLLKYAPYEYYAALESEEAMQMVSDFERLRPAFPEKVRELADGDVFSIGAAKFTVLYTFDPAWPDPNEASLIFRMDLGGKSVMFTGDAGVNAGNKAMANAKGTALMKCDICKMAHHGQNGVAKEFYEAVAPEICLWPTPTWVWDNVNGNLQTLEVRAWMEELGVKQNLVSWQGSQVLYLN